MRMNNKGESGCWMIIIFLPIFVLIMCCVLNQNDKPIEYEGTLTSIKKVDCNKTIGQFYNLTFDEGNFHVLVVDNKKILSEKKELGLNYAITYHSDEDIFYIDSIIEIKPLPPPPTPQQYLFGFIVATMPFTIILLAIIFVRIYCLNHKKPRWIKNSEKAMLVVALVPFIALTSSLYQIYRR